MSPEDVIRGAWERRGKWPEGAETYWIPARPPMSITPWPEDIVTDRLIPKEERAVEFRREQESDWWRGLRSFRIIGRWNGCEVAIQEIVEPLPKRRHEAPDAK